MSVWMGSSTQIGADDLKNCVKLVIAVSARAKNHDLARKTVLKQITDRGKSNSWHIWYHKGGGGIDACCFFQLMLSQSNSYAMCIGFDKTVFPMPADADRKTFIDTMAGTGKGDGYLRDSILHVLNVQTVYLVELNESLQDAQYSQVRNNLFLYMQQQGAGTGWTLAGAKPNNGFRADFWGGDTDENGNVIGLNLWKLNVS
jgi:hypothetical protein